MDQLLSFPINIGWKSQRIKISGMKISSKDVDTIEETLKKHDNIRSLELCFCEISEEDLLRIIDIVKKANLIGLQLARVSMTPFGAAALMTALQETALKKIDVTYNQLEDEGFKSLVSSIRDCGMEALLAARNNITAIGMMELSRTLIETPNTLRTLDLSRNNIGTKGAIQLAEALPHTNLECLLLDMNRITGKGVVALCNAVINTPKLEELALSGNVLNQPDTVKAISNAIAKSNLTHVHLRYSDLDADIMDQLALGVKESMTLKKLELDENRAVTDASMKRFLNTIGAHLTLKYVSLDDSGVTMSCAKDVATRLASLHDHRAMSLIAFVSAKMFARVGAGAQITTLQMELIRQLADMIGTDDQ